MCQDFPLNLVRNRVVTWLLQFGMDYFLISDFHPLSTPSNAVWKLTFSNCPSTPLPCCPFSDYGASDSVRVKLGRIPPDLRSGTFPRQISAPAPLIRDPPPLIWDPLPPNGDPAPKCWDPPPLNVESHSQQGAKHCGSANFDRFVLGLFVTKLIQGIIVCNLLIVCLKFGLVLLAWVWLPYIGNPNK